MEKNSFSSNDLEKIGHLTFKKEKKEILICTTLIN